MVGTATTIGLTIYATPAIAAGTITQSAPTAGSVTVAASPAFMVQLAVTSNNGVVTYTKTGGSTHLAVSTGGRVATTGLLLPGVYTATGTTSDPYGDSGTFTYTLTVGAISQVAPTAGSATVNGSSSFNDQLAVTGNDGAVTYAKTGGSAFVTVSAAGAIATTGTLAAGVNTVSGTTSDPNGDSGTFTYALTVGTITQATPTSGSSTVAGSSTFTDHLAVTGNAGSVTYAKTGGSASLTVSATGKVATTGLLLPGLYTATGTTSDPNGDSGTFTYALAVGTITQAAPATGSSTVAGSSTFTDHLAVTGNNGAVTYAKTGGSAFVTVSAAGAIATTGTLAAGVYTVSGTASDPNGDSGTFTYTLTVTISQIAPTAGSATVTGSSAFADQLAVTGNAGAVTFAKTGGSAFVTVSASGAIATTGTLAAGPYTVTGTTSDTSGGGGTFTYTLTVTAATITQSEPTAGSSTVTGSSGFTDQLAATGSNGAVTYTKSGGGPKLSVSASGAIATNGTLSVGVYTVTGTTSDPFGDGGTFTYTLTVTPGTITQSAPTAGSVTVAASSGFTDQLAVTGNTGAVTYAKTGGSTRLTVSAGGEVATTGLLLPGVYTASGTTSDPYGDSGTLTYALTVGTITQAAPTAGSSTVAGSSTFTAHLAVTGNNGAMSYAKTGGSASLAVSATGTVATTGTLPAGPYTVTGTTSDPNGDSGTFTFALTVTAGKIAQAAPTEGGASVPRSSAFNAQLAVTGSTGAVTYARTGGSSKLTLSARGKVSTTGILAVGADTVTGTTSDSYGDSGAFTFTLRVTAVPITQTGSIAGSSTVAGARTYRHQLTVTGNLGAVTYTKTATSTHLRVSSHGVITTTGTLAAGSYNVRGTTKDRYGDHGTFRFTVTVH